MYWQSRDFSQLENYLWTDLPDALARLDAETRATDRTILAHFVEQGYAILPHAVENAAVDRLLTDFAALLVDPANQVTVEYWRPDRRGKLRTVVRPEFLDKPEAKVLDLYAYLPSVHPVIFSPSLLAFMRDVFLDEPVAFQSLYFEYGSQQDAHNDTAYVPVDPPDHLVASWIALEDIGEGTGELFFFPRSHRMEEQRFINGRKAMDFSDPDRAIYSEVLKRMAHQRGSARTHFRPQKTDALFWAANLIHGGEKIKHHRTRRSIVTHYCPLKAVVPYARHLGKSPLRLPLGGYILSQN